MFETHMKLLYTLAGKYLGVLDRIPEIKGMGVKAVMLTPITLGGEGLGPMGRAPFSFFAPEPSFATDTKPSAASTELKQLIKGLHEEGVEVYLQVLLHSFCGTATPE